MGTVHCKPCEPFRIAADQRLTSWLAAALLTDIVSAQAKKKSNNLRILMINS